MTALIIMMSVNTAALFVRAWFRGTFLTVGAAVLHLLATVAMVCGA